MTKMHVPIIDSDGGPWATHDVACPVCQEDKAVLDIGTLIFHPCWICQTEGWETRKRKFGKGRIK